MLYIAIKALISGLIIAIVSEVAKRTPALGALILSLPLISILAFIWLWRDTGDKEGIAALAKSTFWFVLPTLLLFLVLPILLFLPFLAMVAVMLTQTRRRTRRQSRPGPGARWQRDGSPPPYDWRQR